MKLFNSTAPQFEDDLPARAEQQTLTDEMGELLQDGKCDHCDTDRERPTDHGFGGERRQPASQSGRKRVPSQHMVHEPFDGPRLQQLNGAGHEEQHQSSNDSRHRVLRNRAQSLQHG